MELNDFMKKAVWSCKDVMEYATTTGLKISHGKAYQIIQRAKAEFNGSTSYKATYAKRDAVLQVFGTTVDKELDIWLKANQRNTSPEPIG